MRADRVAFCTPVPPCCDARHRQIQPIRGPPDRGSTTPSTLFPLNKQIWQQRKPFAFCDKPPALPRRRNGLPRKARGFLNKQIACRILAGLLTRKANRFLKRPKGLMRRPFGLQGKPFAFRRRPGAFRRRLLRFLQRAIAVEIDARSDSASGHPNGGADPRRDGHSSAGRAAAGRRIADQMQDILTNEPEDSVTGREPSSATGRVCIVTLRHDLSITVVRWL
jgi:hypothetical protein